MIDLGLGEDLEGAIDVAFIDVADGDEVFGVADVVHVVEPMPPTPMEATLSFSEGVLPEPART